MLTLCVQPDLFSLFRRWTDATCPLRHDMRFGSVDLRGTPSPRTHDEATAEGAKSDAYTGPACHHPRSASGINGATPFSDLPFFNIIRDFCPDVMHVIVNYFLHFLPLLMGERRPNKARNFNPPSGAASEAERQAYKDEFARLTRAQEACSMMTLSTADRERIDTRLFDLSLCPKFIKKAHVPFKTRTGGKKPKAADWYTLQTLLYMFT